MERSLRTPKFIPLRRDANDGDRKGGDGKGSGGKKKDSSKERATQTLFKTLSQNNYRLQEMIDRKANILISVNAIILSILVGTTYAQDLFVTQHNLHLIILLAASTLSILAALIAIKPFLISSDKAIYKGNSLLTFEAAHQMDFQSYKKAVKKTIKKENKIYDAMVEDIFFISKNIARKHMFLKTSGLVFGLGLVVSAIIIIVNVWAV